MGLRLKLRRNQAEAGDIVLLYGDESDALTHPYLAHAWALRGADLRVAAPGQSRKVAIMGVLDATARDLIIHTSTTKHSTDFIALLDSRYGPQPGRTARSVVFDDGPIHTSEATAAAITARPWLTVEWLPRYAPERNDIELAWRDLERHHFSHRTFQHAVNLDIAIREAVQNVDAERQRDHSCGKLRIAA